MEIQPIGAGQFRFERILGKRFHAPFGDQTRTAEDQTKSIVAQSLAGSSSRSSDATRWCLFGSSEVRNLAYHLPGKGHVASSELLPSAWRHIGPVVPVRSVRSPRHGDPLGFPHTHVCHDAS